MKLFNKYILEAILKGINIALDDFEDEEILTLKDKKYFDSNLTKDIVELYSLFIDMGFPSGTLWYKYNLGVNYKTILDSKNPEDWFGNYYSWAEIKPKGSYLERYYKFGFKPNNAAETLMTKYNFLDHLMKLLPEDDAAVLNDLYKVHWLMPTKKLLYELIQYTDYKYEQDYKIQGLYGVRFRSRINKNEIFIPCAGIKQYKKNAPWGLNTFFAIWSSLLESPAYSTGANALTFNKEVDNNLDVHPSYRWAGFTIRSVLNRN